MKLMRVGVDLAKNIFQVHGIDRQEQPVWRRRLTRKNWFEVLLKTVEPGCEIGMEACGGSHHWARQRCGSDLRGDEPTEYALRGG